MLAFVIPSYLDYGRTPCADEQCASRSVSGERLKPSALLWPSFAFGTYWPCDGLCEPVLCDYYDEY